MLLDDCYISYLNLDHRKDRLEHIQKELAKVGINAVRTRGKLPQEYDLTDPKLRVMKNRTPGAIPCHYGQVEIMQTALELGKHAFVMEDDSQFCTDFQERMKGVEEFLKDKDWTFFWFGGTYTLSPGWWHKDGHSVDMQMCKCTLGKDVEATEDKSIVRTYGCFSTHSYLVNVKWIEEVLLFLEENVHLSMGIDWLMILMQPHVNAFAPCPGMIRQIDNLSDIGKGYTIFSGFKMLGEHWWQDKVEDFNYDNFKI